MNQFAQAQEQARRFNEEEAIREEFERLCALRIPLPKPLHADEKLLDDLDWLAASRMRRQTRAVGFCIP